MASTSDHNLIRRLYTEEGQAKFKAELTRSKLKTKGLKLVNIRTGLNGFGCALFVVEYLRQWVTDNHDFPLIVLASARLEVGILSSYLDSKHLSESPTAGKVYITTYAESKIEKSAASQPAPKLVILMLLGSSIHTIDTIITGGRWLEWAVDQTMGKPDAAVNILTISSAPWPLFNRDNLEATAEFLGYENYHSPSIFHSIQIDPTLHTQFCENDIDEFDESQLLDQCTQIVLELQPDKRDQLQENNEALSTEYVNEKADDFISIACFMPQDIFKDFVRGFNRSQARKVDFGEVTDDMDVKVVLSAFEMNRQKKDVFLRIDPAITLLPPMRNLAASLILRRRTHHIFDPESSHMVRTLTLMSQFELQQAKQMCSIRGTIGDETVLAPSYLLCPEWAAHFKETPKPNAFNRDIMSFLFRLVATFPKRCLQDMPVLLPHDWRMVNEYLRRLIAMGCIHQPMSGREELKINKGRGYNMRKLMHIENDFHSLFLLGGIETNMPSALKRVFIRLSVIVSGDNYKFIYMNETPETDPVTKRGLKLECSIGIGKEFCTNGGIWLALGLWESHMERYKVVSSPEPQKVFFGDRIILYHEEAKRIQERVNELEQLLELDPLTEADEEALSKDDILIIEIELVKSRIHNLVYFRKPANEDDDVKGLDCTSGKWLETNYDDIVDWTSYFRPEYDGFFAIYLWLEQPVPGQYVACGLTAVSTEAAMHVLKDVATVPDATGQPTLQLSLLLSTYPDMK